MRVPTLPLHHGIGRDWSALCLSGLLMLLGLAIPLDGQHLRTVKGKVMTDNEGIKAAVVQLKNTRTLMVRSFISQKDGAYHFYGLNPDIDYEIVARRRGRSSSKKTISQFDSRLVVELDLVLDRDSEP